MEYGIPDLSKYHSNQRSNNIIVFNLENNAQIDSFHKTISSNIPNTHMIKGTVGMSLQNLASVLSSYKICIDFSSKINSLFSMSCGVDCIGSLSTEQNNPLAHHAIDYNSIINMINKVLSQNTTDETRKTGATQICLKYNYELFKNNITEIFTNLKKNEIFRL